MPLVMPQGSTIRLVGPLSILLVALASASAADPAREFIDGHRLTFSTKDHPKARGVHFTIAYPRSWIAKEGERPNVVQVFVSDGGQGLEGAAIITRKLPLPDGTALSEQDQRDLLSPQSIKEMLPAGATFNRSEATEIEAVPAAILEYRVREDRAGMRLLLQAWSLSFLSGNTLVQVHFNVGGTEGTDADLVRRMSEFKPLFTLMANSIVFPDKWKNGAPNTSPAVTNRSAASSRRHVLPNLLVLVVSFLVTWSLALAPPILIRYTWVRRPLSKKAASWIAAGLSAFFWFSFQLLAHVMGEKPGTGVVWIVAFFVARWIMVHGSVPPAPSPRATVVKPLEPSPIRFRCPNPACPKTLRVPPELMGRKLECPFCHWPFVISQISSAEEG